MGTRATEPARGRNEGGTVTTGMAANKVKGKVVRTTEVATGNECEWVERHGANGHNVLTLN